MRAVGVLLGMSDPDRPHISSTPWRTLSDHGAKNCHLESALRPAIFRVHFEKSDLGPGTDPKKLGTDGPEVPAGLGSRPVRAGKPLRLPETVSEAVARLR